jgi:hypothetical protein
MKWDKRRILSALRKLHRAGANLSYNAMARKHQAVVSAAAYHFGSYRSAITHAGIDYRQVLCRPRWTRQSIIALIKKARRRGVKLHWSAITRRGDELSRAAFASLQPRLFGAWDRALHAAGLDAEDVSIYRTWDRNTAVFEIRSRHQSGDPLSSGAVQREDPALHAAAVRYWRTWDNALRAAHFNPSVMRQRRRWSKPAVIAALKKAWRRTGHVSDSSIRGTDPALHGAAVRLFGTFTASRAAAGIKLKGRRIRSAT